MPTRIRPFIVIFTLLMLSSTGIALADITLTIDQPEYYVGDIVHAEATNNGPEVEQFISAPFFLIFNQDTNECVYGCVGLPVITDFPVGETVSMDYDTGFMPDLPGTHVVGLALFDSPTVTYVLHAPVAAEASSWGTLKALFR